MNNSFVDVLYKLFRFPRGSASNCSVQDRLPRKLAMSGNRPLPGVELWPLRRLELLSFRSEFMVFTPSAESARLYVLVSGA